MARQRGGNRQTQPFTEEDLNALFWEQVDMTGECWLWTGPRDNRPNKGYGIVTRRGRTQSAHRTAWTIVNGPIPKGLEIRHLVCDNPPCVRPAHLAVGTHLQNEADKKAKSRQSRLGRRKFSDDDIRAVVGLVGLGWAQWQAASLFGMDPSHVSRLVRGESGRLTAGYTR